MKSNLLCIIVDVNPVIWGHYLTNCNAQNESAALANVLESVIAACNAHFATSANHKLLLIAVSYDGYHLLFPRNARNNSFGDFSEQISLIDSDLQSLVQKCQALSPDQLVHRSYHATRFVSAFTKCILYINGFRRNLTGGDSLHSRVLLVSFYGSADEVPLAPGEHMGLMNIFFTAQKQNIIIDACLIAFNSQHSQDGTSALFEQAVDVTGGICMKLSTESNLLMVLLNIFMSDSTIRSKMVLPHSANVDYRPACICHQKLLKVGFVCSVCLSVYCSFRGICATCDTVFMIKPQGSANSKKVAKKTKKVKTHSATTTATSMTPSNNQELTSKINGNVL